MWIDAVTRGTAPTPPRIDNRNTNRDLKYLLANLRRSGNKEDKAQSMLSYLNGCSFNPCELPDKIIRFSSEEATVGSYQ